MRRRRWRRGRERRRGGGGEEGSEAERRRRRRRRGRGAAVMEALQMTWQPQLRRRAGPPLGLKNLGNSCYLNSVLQCLTYTPPRPILPLLATLLSMQVADRESGEGVPVLRPRAPDRAAPEPRRAPPRRPVQDPEVPGPVRRALPVGAPGGRARVPPLRDRRLPQRLPRPPQAAPCRRREGAGAGGPSTVMKEIFGGALLSQVKCLSCKEESNKTDEIMDISLDLFQSTSLKDALARFFQPEVLEGSNKYNCGKCRKLSVARKQMFVLRAPNVLVIQLKRFEGIHGGKINRNIEFEEVLALSKFMYNTAQDSQSEYNLFGSIVHSGFSHESGHYYAYIKDASGRWYCCNDAHVSPSSTQEVLSEKVYVLFYLLSKPSLKSNKTNHQSHATKPSESNGNHVTPSKSSELLKAPLAKPNGTSSSSKNNNTNVLKNGRIAPNPQIKFEIKRFAANGKSNAETNNNAAIKGKDALPESGSLGESTSECSEAINGSTLSHSVESNSNGNGCANLLRKVHENGSVERENGNPTRRIIKNDNSGVSKSGREPGNSGNVGDSVIHSGESVISSKDDSCKTKSTGSRHFREELEKFKEVLVGEATSELQSCGWVDDVHNFMQSRKRLCMQEADDSPDSSVIRKQLTTEAKRTFISQIPESLKGHLIERLRSFSKRKFLSDD
uniref:ubiquitinyl hydrolase 1 n=1 Tax=Ananas comosus var. bracteatus TaxID=296719 RepID=A0A6V7PB73_ANACO|nr:unnamed protein product [Ananas comosus var. bracteatus]